MCSVLEDEGLEAVLGVEARVQMLLHRLARHLGLRTLGVVRQLGDVQLVDEVARLLEREGALQVSVRDGVRVRVRVGVGVGVRVRVS